MIVQAIKKKVEENRDNIINFMREICAIPSMDGQLKEVGERIGAEMNKLGFEDVRFDKMGNILGRIGPSSSLNAVPHQFTIYLDRRITLSEPRDEVIAQIKGLIPDYLQDEIHVEELFYDTPSYTGFVYPVSKFYPPWLLDDKHPLTQAGQRTIEALWGETRALGTWDFSTNGTYWAGKAGVPSIGFGPGDEKFAHTSLEQVPLDEVVAATGFYALFPHMLSTQVRK